MIAAKLAAFLAAALAATAPPGGNKELADILARADRALAEASAARAPQPPVPVPVTWGAKRLGSIELGGPLLALEAADLDGDGKDELVALTTTEIDVVATSGGLAVIASAPLPPKPATIRSRDPVGTLVIGGGGGGVTVTARTSEQAVGARYLWKGGALVADAEVAGYPLCAELSAELTPGRDTYDPATVRWSGEAAEATPIPVNGPFWAAECRRHVAADGAPIWTVAVAGADRDIDVSCRRGGEPCAAGVVAAPAVGAAGYAFEVADVDRDGSLEVIASRGQPPGERDRIRVFAAAAGGARKLVLSHWFEGGVVAVAAPDLDGDGALEALAAVRLPGSKRINLWTLCAAR